MNVKLKIPRQIALNIDILYTLTHYLSKVTTFAEVMTEEDVKRIQGHLNQEKKSYAVVTHYLKDFVKESQFTKVLRYG